MSSPQTELSELLQQHKFVLVRERNHLKYENPQGKIFVTAKTPSDWRSTRNAVAMLKRIVASPSPLSQVVEEERQRKLLEQTIQLPAAQPQRPAGAGSAGKKTNGSGIRYKTVRVPFVTEADRETSRLATVHSKTIHEANQRVRDLQQQFINYVRGTYTAALDMHVRTTYGSLEHCEEFRQECIKERGGLIAIDIAGLEVVTVQEIQERAVASHIARDLPEVVKQAKKIASTMEYRLTDEGMHFKISFLKPCAFEDAEIWQGVVRLYTRFVEWYMAEWASQLVSESVAEPVAEPTCAVEV